MREVIVYENYKQKKEEYKAKFHKFGCECEEFESGIGNYSIAIVEKVDGTIQTPPANCIKFIS